VDRLFFNVNLLKQIFCLKFLRRIVADAPPNAKQFKEAAP